MNLVSIWRAQGMLVVPDCGYFVEPTRIPRMLFLLRLGIHLQRLS